MSCCGVTIEAHRNADLRKTYGPRSRNYTFSGFSPLMQIRDGTTVLLSITLDATANGSLFAVSGDSLVLTIKKTDILSLTNGDDDRILSYDIVLTQGGLEDWFLGGDFIVLDVNDATCEGDSDVTVELGGQSVDVTISGGNIGVGASVLLADLNQAVEDAEQAAEDATVNGGIAGAAAGATAGEEAGEAAGATAGTAAATEVLSTKADLTDPRFLVASKFRGQTDLAATPLWQDGISPADTIYGGIDAAPLAPITTKSMIAIGGGALYRATNPQNMIAIGVATMSANANPGRHNISIGEGSFTYLDGTGGGFDATRNVGLGQLTGHFSTTAAFCGYYHRNAGHSNTTGQHDIGVGYRATGGAENPIGLDGKITLLWPLTASYQTGVGNDALRYSNGDFNTASGYICLQYAKGSRNAAHGAGALSNLDRDISFAGFALDRTLRTGTYTQTGTTITVNVTGANVAVGKTAHIKFDTGAINAVTSEYILATAVTAPSADAFTFTSPVSLTASGNCTIDWVETTTPATAGVRNYAGGHNAGSELLSGKWNVLLGAEAGTGQGTSYDGKFLLHVNSANARPLLAGDFVSGRLAVNANLSDLAHPFQVFDTTGKEQFRCEASVFTRIIGHDDSAGVGPVVVYDRRTASPANGDTLGSTRYYAPDSGGAETNFSDDFVTAITVTDGAETAKREWRTMQAGAMSVRLAIGAGVYHPSAPGTDKGNNSINFSKGWFQTLNVAALATYADNAAAIAGGLAAGEVYRTATGQVMVRY